MRTRAGSRAADAWPHMLGHAALGAVRAGHCPLQPCVFASLTRHGCVCEEAHTVAHRFRCRAHLAGASGCARRAASAAVCGPVGSVIMITKHRATRCYGSCKALCQRQSAAMAADACRLGRAAVPRSTCVGWRRARARLCRLTLLALRSLDPACCNPLCVAVDDIFKRVVDLRTNGC